MSGVTSRPIGFEAALRQTLALAIPLPTERQPLSETLGRTLAEDVTATTDLPRFAASERDGYALDPAALVGPPPYRLRLAGSQRTGAAAARLVPGTAARLFTGAPMPNGAQAVVMQEEALLDGDFITVQTAPAVGAHVRRRGEDLTCGGLALARGTRIGPGALSWLAMLGRTEVEVSARPRVAILPNGDELRPLGATLGEGQIHEANALALAALARQAGAQARTLPIAPDTLTAVERAISNALASCDLLVTVGGVSVGDHDLVRPALEALGVTLSFWRVAIKPGKPLALGQLGEKRILCLPGNPASALVTFGLFGCPLLRASQGDAQPTPLALPARLETATSRSSEREHFLRVTLGVRDGALWAQPLPQQAAGAAMSLAGSDGLARLPIGDGVLAVGAPVSVFRWSDF